MIKYIKRQNIRKKMEECIKRIYNSEYESTVEDIRQYLYDYDLDNDEEYNKLMKENKIEEAKEKLIQNFRKKLEKIKEEQEEKNKITIEKINNNEDKKNNLDKLIRNEKYKEHIKYVISIIE